MNIIEAKQNRYRILLQQLEIMRLYPDEFIEKLGGEKAFREKVDEILDEMNEVKNFIKKSLNK